jgi:hypothetical protein
MKGTGRVKKKISRLLGNNQKKKFEKFIYSNTAPGYFEQRGADKAVNIELVSFVNAASFPDLALSMLSFLNAAGRPKKWTLYVDDEFSQYQKNIISKLSFAELRKWDETLNEADKRRFSKRWQLRKFAAYAGHRLNGTTIFLDSDVLFYPLFSNYLDSFESGNWYLPEPPEANNIDDDLIKHFDFKRQMYIVNAGFFIFNTTPDWHRGFEYLDFCSQTEKEHYFLDQSALNIMYHHDLNARILDPRVFHATADDHFMLRALNTSGFAIRHYVGLIRHKMWQLGWKGLFK